MKTTQRHRQLLVSKSDVNKPTVADRCHSNFHFPISKFHFQFPISKSNFHLPVSKYIGSRADRRAGQAMLRRATARTRTAYTPGSLRRRVAEKAWLQVIEPSILAPLFWRAPPIALAWKKDAHSRSPDQTGLYIDTLCTRTLIVCNAY